MNVKFGSSCFVISLICVAEAGLMGDQCDWTGSGLNSEVARAVTAVRLRCAGGAVSWRYPRGALRVELAAPAADRRRVCVRVHAANHTAPSQFAARIFVQEPSRLAPLYAPGDGDPRVLRCFGATSSTPALYVEAIPEDGPRLRVAEFTYEVVAVDTKEQDLASAECKPCSERQMEYAFCTSNLVVRGTWAGAEVSRTMDSTRLALRVTSLLRALPPHPALYKHYYRLDTDDNTLSAGRKLVHIHAPSTCGAAPGKGEFLVMATHRLGRYTLVCAPRIEEWKDLVRTRNESDSICILQY